MHPEKRNVKRYIHINNQGEYIDIHIHIYNLIHLLSRQRIASSFLVN